MYALLRIEAEAGVFPCVALIIDQLALLPLVKRRDRIMDYFKLANEGA
jgi:hypothetical protein